MKVSLIICTRNRASHLEPTLWSLRKSCPLEKANAQILVVDNGSSDNTGAVIRRHAFEQPVIQHIFEPKTGLSVARNRGLREAKGDLILFTDDDVRVPENWIARMALPILSGDADAVAGDVIFPPQIAELLSHPPLNTRRDWFASSENLDRARPMRMIGANMAFHRRVLEKTPQFDTELGAGALGFGEETLFSWQLQEAGFRIARARDCAVEHHFDVTRVNEFTLRESARRMGRSSAFIDYHWQHKDPPSPRKQLMRNFLRRTKWRCLAQLKLNDGLFSDQMLKLDWAHGYYAEYLRQSTRPRKYPQRGFVPHKGLP